MSRQPTMTRKQRNEAATAIARVVHREAFGHRPVRALTLMSRLASRDAEQAAMGYYDDADKAHEAGNYARERYLRYWGDRTALEARA